MSLPRDLLWLVNAVTAQVPPRPTHLRRIGISAADGLGIYRHAYRARLIECLADDFSALQALLGENHFDRIAESVIVDSPPREKTLNRYGRHVITFLRRHPSATSFGDLALDIARLEWAIVEAIHAPLAPPIPHDLLAKIPQSEWPGIRLKVAPSLRIISSRWPIDMMYRQHLRGEVPVVPLPDPEFLLVFRRPDGLQRIAMVPERGRLISSLVRGLSLGEALARTRLGPEDVCDAIATVVSAGVFTSFTKDSP
jgi:hypothetical protein